MRNIFTLLAALLLSQISVTCRPVNTDQIRSADTCADPTLTTVYVEAFSPSRSGHTLRPTWVFVSADTAGDNWQIQSEIFLGWEVAQDFTVPFHQLFDSTISDFIYLPEVNGNPPTASGYTAEGIAGYAYSTQVCGSVPLLSAFQAIAGDHWYTTDANQHSSLLASGWVDGGIPFYVLPLNT